MADFIARHSTTGIVYVHCKIGYSRSAGAIGAFLLASGHATSLNEAIRTLRKVRPSIVIRREVLDALTRFSATVVPAHA
jgi:protein phosphatase